MLLSLLCHVDVAQLSGLDHANPNALELLVIIPKVRSGLIIGKSGATIHELIAKSRASIEMNQSVDRCACVCVCVSVCVCVCVYMCSMCLCAVFLFFSHLMPVLETLVK